MTIEVRRLRSDDDRSAFRSGDLDLDRFFQRFAGQNQFKHHLGTTWVAVENRDIAGFATVAATAIAVTDLPEERRRNLPSYPLPALRLARLATDERFTGRGVGSALMAAVFHLALETAETIGCIGVVVDAKRIAVPFYERFGFEPLGEVERGRLAQQPDVAPMFLPLSMIR